MLLCQMQLTILNYRKEVHHWLGWRAYDFCGIASDDVCASSATSAMFAIIESINVYCFINCKLYHLAIFSMVP